MRGSTEFKMKLYALKLYERSGWLMELQSIMMMNLVERFLWSN